MICPAKSAGRRSPQVSLGPLAVQGVAIAIDAPPDRMRAASPPQGGHHASGFCNRVPQAAWHERLHDDAVHDTVHDADVVSNIVTSAG